MRKAGMIGLSVLCGGLLLGALLGTHADPVMKDAPQPPWQSTGRAAIEPEPARHFASIPEDLRPYGGYRPDLDYAAEIDDWSPNYPRWAYGDADPSDFAGFGDEIGFSDEPPPLEHDEAEASPAAAERERPALGSAQRPSREEHRIARIQADGLW